VSAATPILLLTHSADFYTVDLVAAAVASRGAKVLRVDTDRYPSQAVLSQDVNAGAHAATLSVDGDVIDLLDVPGIWCRRLYPGHLPPGVDPAFRAACINTSRAMFMGMLDVMPQERFINAPGPMFRAENKLLQLQRARECGLRIPDTLVTSDPTLVRAFFHRHKGKIITKLLTPLSQSMQPDEHAIYTNVVTSEDLEHLAGLRLAPQIFQPLVDKTGELRVIVMDGKFFVGALDPRTSRRGGIDWRRIRMDEDVTWQHHRLPVSVEDKVSLLMKRLGLRYGALDFLLDGQDEPLFLEVNPAGEWGFLQQALELPIAQSIADALVDGVA